MTATLEAPPSGAPQPPPKRNLTSPRAVPAPLAAWADPRPLLGWAMTLVVGLVAGVTRFWALGSPPGANVIPKNGLQFDEAYYPVEAAELLRYGYEDNRGYMFVVHPPLGKWLIAASEWLVGGRDATQNLTNSLGWRIAPAVMGTLAVIIVARTARRMFRSNLFGGIAGLLMAVEGLSVVLSRTGILDIFLQFFVVAAFGALVVDRDKVRARLGALVADGADFSLGGVPSLGPRPWRLLGGLLLGLACSIKWSALSFLVVFVIMSLVWDRGALKSAGVRRPLTAWLRRSILPAVGSLAVVPVAAYLFTWLGWFTGENAWNRHWADTHSSTGRILGIPINFGWVPSPIRSLGAYHADAYDFHKNLDSYHPYESNPWSWLVDGRPVSFYYDGTEKTCGSSECSRAVLALGTPILFWAFIPMLLWLAWHWFSTRDWRAGAVWFAFAAGWLVWFQNLDRTMFFFYMAPLVPFLIIGVTLALGVMLGPALPADPTSPRMAAARRRRTWGQAGVCVFLAFVVMNFAWMWPLYTGGLLPTDVWRAHMWLPSWV